MGVNKVAGRLLTHKVTPEDHAASVDDDRDEQDALCESEVPKIYQVKSNDGLMYHQMLGRRQKIMGLVAVVGIMVVCAAVVATTISPVRRDTLGSAEVPAPQVINVADTQHQTRLDAPEVRAMPVVAGPFTQISDQAEHEPALAVSQIGHPAEHTRSEDPSRWQPLTPAAYNSLTPAEVKANLQPQTEIGHPPERTATAAPPSRPVPTAVGHPAEYTRTMPPTEQDDAREKDAPSCVYGMNFLCPARSLFQNPEVLDASTESIMAAGQRLFGPSDRTMVRDVVRESFRNISIELKTRAPEVAKELDLLQLDQTRKDAVLKSLKLASNPRVQKLGMEVARAIAGCHSSDKAHVRRQVEARLRPHLASLRNLRDELVPESLQSLWGSAHLWEMTLDAENVRVMETGGTDLASRFSPTASVDLSEKASGILGGVMEEGRALIDMIKLVTRSYGKDLAVPMWATSMVGRVSPHLLSCEADAYMDSKVDFMKAVWCPLKFGTQGLDALRAAAVLESEDGSSTLESTLGQALVDRERKEKEIPVGHPPERTVTDPPTQDIVVVGHPAEHIATEPPAQADKQEATPVGHPYEHTATSPPSGAGGCDFGASSTCRASQLFEDSEIIDVTTESMMLAGRQFLEPADRKVVRDTIASSFRNISAQLRRQAPEAAQQLDALKITQPEKHAVTASLRIVNDPRVQRLGFEVAEAIHESYIADREHLKVQIETKLRPKIEEIRKLRDELVPQQLFELWGKGRQWDLTMEADNIRAMETLSGKLTFEVDGLTSMDLEEKSYAILGGVIEEGRALVGIIELCTRSRGKELRLPLWATSLAGRVDPDLRCEADSSKKASIDFMKVLYCPLKFGTQGLDALRVASAIAEAS